MLNIIKKILVSFIDKLLGGIIGFCIGLLGYFFIVPAFLAQLFLQPVIKSIINNPSKVDKIFLLVSLILSFPVVFTLTAGLTVLSALTSLPLITAMYGLVEGVKMGVSDLPAELYSLLYDLFIKDYVDVPRQEIISVARQCLAQANQLKSEVNIPAKQQTVAPTLSIEPEKTYQNYCDILKSLDMTKNYDSLFKDINKKYVKFICPITLELPNDPINLVCIRAGSDCTYIHPQPFERKVVEKALYLKQQHPLTRERVIDIIPDAKTKNKIMIFLRGLKQFVGEMVWMTEKLKRQDTVRISDKQSLLITANKIKAPQTQQAPTTLNNIKCKYG